MWAKLVQKPKNPTVITSCYRHRPLTCFSSVGPPSCGWSLQRAAMRGSAWSPGTQPSRCSGPGPSWANAAGRQVCLLWQLWRKTDKSVRTPSPVSFLTFCCPCLCFVIKKRIHESKNNYIYCFQVFCLAIYSIIWCVSSHFLWKYSKHASIWPEDIRQQFQPRALIRSPSCLKRSISSDHDCPCEQVFVLKWLDLLEIFFFKCVFVSVSSSCYVVAKCKRFKISCHVNILLQVSN